MSDSAGALDALLAAHDRIGSPMRQYLRAGLASAEVASQLRAVGVYPVDSLVDLYGWANGIDYRSWALDYPGAPDLAVLPFGTFVSLERAVDRYRSVMATAKTLAERLATQRDAYWRGSWFPIIGLGDEEVAIDCVRDEGRGRVWTVRFDAVPDEPTRVIFDGLEELACFVADQIEAGIYRWDERLRSLVETRVGAEFWPTGRRPG